MIMENFNFQFTHRTKICFGIGKFQEAGAITKDYGQRALIVSDKVLSELGIVSKLQSLLADKDVETCVFDKVKPNPRDTDCEEAAALGREFKADVIIGLGGGSALDSAKAVNVLLTQNGDCYQHSKTRKFTEELLPSVAIPTTSGTGSEVTFEAVITIEELGKKVSMSDGCKLAPCVAIVDPELTLSVPPIVTASTGMDALTHALEAYTCNFAQPITDSMAFSAMGKIAGNIEKATFEGSDILARSEMMLGSMMAGLAFTNSYLGAVHSFSECLGGFYDIPHGIANAIFLPFVTEYNMSSNWEKHALVAKAMGIDIYGLSNEEASKEGVKKLFELNEKLNIPKFSELDRVKPKDFPIIAELCNKHPCGFKANPREITTKDYIEIFNKAYEY